MLLICSVLPFGIGFWNAEYDVVEISTVSATFSDGRVNGGYIQMFIMFNICVKT